MSSLPPASIFAFDHYTSRAILTLQRQTASGWEDAGGCAMDRATQRIEIKAGATMLIALASAWASFTQLPGQPERIAPFSATRLPDRTWSRVPW